VLEVPHRPPGQRHLREEASGLRSQRRSRRPGDGPRPGHRARVLCGPWRLRDHLPRPPGPRPRRAPIVSASWRLLLVSGSLRAASTNTAVLRTAVEVAPPETSATVFDGLARLPYFNPDDDTDPLVPAVAELRSAIDAADGLLVSTPEYAGALPGSFKNLLDWLVGGVEISCKPTGWINASLSSTAAAGAHASLRTVLGYVDADVVEAACAHIPVPRGAVGANGTITDSAIRSQIAVVVQALVDHIAAHAPGTDMPGNLDVDE
jgi:chromate reductase, NAD(P)H dehydrogenase (quinone)